MKGAPPRHPYVTLRLETPVIYFYPPKSQATPLTLNVEVQFHGGWLTQFYPQAEPDAPGLKQKQFDFGPIDRNTIGRLTWTNLKVGAAGQPPPTDEPVWLTPRNVHASTITTPEGESEKYLFYRGVGNIRSPLAVVSDVKGDVLTIRACCEEVLAPGEKQPIAHLWLVHIQPDGLTAFRALDRIQIDGDHPGDVVAKIKSSFSNADYKAENLSQLQQAMHAALMDEGLFDEEATAMLQTWQKSYFRSGGLRLFYTVPRAWVDHYLPLTISRAAEIKRVMIARTELFSPEQQILLKRLAHGPVTDSAWLSKLHDSPNVRKFLQGRSDFGNLGTPIPQDYQTYLDLGRFRNALVLHEQACYPTPALNQFIAGYCLEQFQPPIPKSSQ